FIDGLKKLAEERSEYERTKVEATPVAVQSPTVIHAPAQRAARANDSGPAADKQIQALERLALQKGLELDAETRRRYGSAAHGLTFGQAGELLSEWQRRP
ncbi:MAG: hypothetical protein SH847_17865, partial [Roseiflexaceae bacterium]|nr:hypothetical protein [Roseiflexaceae bacterium]